MLITNLIKFYRNAILFYELQWKNLIINKQITKANESRAK